MRRTQRAIKQVLTERYYSWRDAETIARDDPEIDLSGAGPLYNPRDFEADEDFPEEELEAFDAQEAQKEELIQEAQTAEGVPEDAERKAESIPEGTRETKPEVRPNA